MLKKKEPAAADVKSDSGAGAGFESPIKPNLITDVNNLPIKCHDYGCDCGCDVTAGATMGKVKCVEALKSNRTLSNSHLRYLSRFDGKPPSLAEKRAIADEQLEQKVKRMEDEHQQGCWAMLQRAAAPACVPCVKVAQKCCIIPCTRCINGGDNEEDEDEKELDQDYEWHKTRLRKAKPKIVSRLQTFLVESGLNPRREEWLRILLEQQNDNKMMVMRINKIMRIGAGTTVHHNTKAGLKLSKLSADKINNTFIEKENLKLMNRIDRTVSFNVFFS